MFPNLRFDKRIQSAVNLGHGSFLPATLIAQRASRVLLFSANPLLVLAKLEHWEHVVQEGTGKDLNMRTFASRCAARGGNPRNGPVRSVNRSDPRTCVVAQDPFCFSAVVVVRLQEIDTPRFGALIFDGVGAILSAVSN
jgi:hypothetical protein